jgi:hypothetical protein
MKHGDEESHFEIEMMSLVCFVCLVTFVVSRLKLT